MQALTTTRTGGASTAPWDSFNLGHHVGDLPESVTANRAALAQALPAKTAIQWLEQVHGIDVIEAGRNITSPQADACWTRETGLACAVMTADCLPVLFCDRKGTVVAAAHAGWRGLQAGILEATVSSMGVAPGDILAWLGPAIGPSAFEVGPEVREAFLASSEASETCFSISPGKPGHFLADIYALARQRLTAVGVNRVYGGDFCTYSDSERFFSYRRDGQTGRMTSVILIQ